MADDDDDQTNGNGDDSDESTVTWNVSSECIATLAYDKERGEAVYTFHKGGTEYRTPMSLQQATAWAHSDSVGAYFNEKIKGVYGAYK